MRHGYYGTPTHNSWRKMLSRCRSEHYAQYYNDVEVCDRWDTRKGGNFLNFLEDMGEKPEGKTLNRVGSSKIYSKDTCEWADLSMQSYDTKRKSHNKSGRTGVKFREDRGVWEARITYKKKIKILYYGDSFQDACKAREEAELEYYGFNKE